MKILGEEKKVVIIGCGRLGGNLATRLYEQGHNVIVVDQKEEAFIKLQNSYGGLTFIKDATELETFSSIGIDEYTTLIVVTNNDNTNIMISQIARELFHVKNIVCRLYDPQSQCIYDEFDIDTICPTYLSVNCIEDILQHKGVHA